MKVRWLIICKCWGKGSMEEANMETRVVNMKRGNGLHRARSRLPSFLMFLVTISYCCNNYAAQESAASGDPLPSWNNTGPKQAIISFVAKVTKEGSPDFVPVRERIATFDN